MHTKQRGVVLVISLIFLAVMTMLVLSMVRTSLLELKIGGVNQEAEAAFATAEVSISQYINDNAGRFAPGCLNNDPADGDPNLARQACRWTTGVGMTTTLTDTDKATLAGVINDRDVTVVVTHPANPSTAARLGSGIQMPSGMNGSSLCQLPFNVRTRVSDSAGIFGGDVIVNQGLHSFFAGTGSCS
jgi:Tfp pilus assembly protein PilX